jgi:hypothetical protein
VAIWLMFWLHLAIEVESELGSRASMLMAFMPAFLLLAAMISR